MSSITLHDSSGKNSGSIDLLDDLFGIEPNMAVLHQVVTAQLAARRSGTQSTKTRRDVTGGGAKPYRQKGTGNARQGSITAPHFRGGGVAFAPKPRSYEQKTPKKMKKLALRSALSDRASEDKIVVVEDFGFETPSTKGAIALLKSLEIEGRVLVVITDGDEITWKSFRNLQHAHVVTASELNPYDVLVADFLLFSKETLPGAESPATGEADKTEAEA